MTDQTNFDPGFPPLSPPPAPAGPPPPPPWWYGQRPRDGFGRRMLRGLGRLIFVVSILLNIYLLFALSMMVEAEGMSTTVLRSGNLHEVVAVYRLSGGIDDQAVQHFRRFYDQASGDANVKAIVLRVDSPGGEAASADEIHRMVRNLQTAGGKKVVISMGSVAASGGYYISAPADEIFAEHNSITGSVGVIMAWLVMKGTLDKIGMEAMVLKSTDAEGWKDLISPFKKPDERQKAALLNLLDTVQKRFEQVVREGRGDRLKTRENTYTVTVGEGVDAHVEQRTETVPLNGQIFTAEEALKLGLIDTIGYEDDAITRAGELAKLTAPKVVLYEPRKGFLTRLLEERGPTGVKIGPELLDRLQTPRVLLMWKVD